MARAAQCIVDDGGIEFGYLRCREEVVPFLHIVRLASSFRS